MLGLADLHAEEIGDLIDRAVSILDSGIRTPRPPLPELSAANLILEPSTRTRCSFELCEQRLGIEFITITEGSSLVKGETVVDTARTLHAMGVNVFVLRHREVGAPARLAEALETAHVVNAGDGTGEHPTQGLLDIVALRRRLGGLDGRRVLIVGDIAHSRVARSGYHGLSKLGASVVLCGPARFLPDPAEYPDAEITDDLDEVIGGADALMALRIQHERLAEGETGLDLGAYRERYGLTAERVEGLESDVPVLHPGPFNRGVEIDGEVADGTRAVIWPQVTAGVAVRMAVFQALAGSGSVDYPDPA